jgi:hypothetical protein
MEEEPRYFYWSTELGFFKLFICILTIVFMVLAIFLKTILLVTGLIQRISAAVKS